MNPAELRELIHDKGFRGEYLASIRHRGKDVLLGDIEKLLEIMIDEYVEIEERKAENATLNQQLSAHQLSQQNIINAFGIKGEGAHSKLVIEYVHGMVAENAALRRIALGYHILTVPEREAPTEPEIDAAIAEIKAHDINLLVDKLSGLPFSIGVSCGYVKEFAANLRAGRKG